MTGSVHFIVIFENSVPPAHLLTLKDLSFHAVALNEDFASSDDDASRMISCLRSEGISTAQQGCFT